MGQGHHKEAIQPIDQVNPILDKTIRTQTVNSDRSIYIKLCNEMLPNTLILKKCLLLHHNYRYFDTSQSPYICYSNDSKSIIFNTQKKTVYLLMQKCTGQINHSYPLENKVFQFPPIFSLSV